MNPLFASGPRGELINVSIMAFATPGDSEGTCTNIFASGDQQPFTIAMPYAEFVKKVAALLEPGSIVS